MSKPEPQTVSNINMVSRIAADTFIKGEILSPSDIRIDGIFDGSLKSAGRVVIGESAKIKGEIICSNIDIWGEVDGKVVIKDIFTLKEGGSVKGEIKTRRLHIELGSSFNGCCSMITEEQFNALAEVEPQKEESPKPSAPAAKPSK